VIRITPGAGFPFGGGKKQCLRMENLAAAKSKLFKSLIEIELLNEIKLKWKLAVI
jgi:hypothetical protein